jgi:hypothetical protein
VLAYAAMKFQICILRKKPLISSVKEENARDVEDKVYLQNAYFKFKFAWGVEDANSPKVLDDPRLVQWAPYLTNVNVTDEGNDELKTTYTPLKYRKCND